MPSLMAQGLSNAVIGRRLFFAELGLEPSPATHRRVLAVLAYLENAPDRPL